MYQVYIVIQIWTPFMQRVYFHSLLPGARGFTSALTMLCNWTDRSIKKGRQFVTWCIGMGIRIEKSNTDEEAIILEDACKKSLILRSNFPWIELWQYVSNKRRARVGYVNDSLQLAQKYAWTFVRDIICSEKQAVFGERYIATSRKTAILEEQKKIQGQKHPRIYIFTPNAGNCVYYP